MGPSRCANCGDSIPPRAETGPHTTDSCQSCGFAAVQVPSSQSNSASSALLTAILVGIAGVIGFQLVFSHGPHAMPQQPATKHPDDRVVASALPALRFVRPPSTEVPRAQVLSDATAGSQSEHWPLTTEAVTGDVQCHRANSPSDEWTGLSIGTEIRDGDEIASDPDGNARLRWGTSGTFTIREMTRCSVTMRPRAGTVPLLEVFVKMGSVTTVTNGEGNRGAIVVRYPNGHPAAPRYDLRSELLESLRRQGVTPVLPR